MSKVNNFVLVLLVTSLFCSACSNSRNSAVTDGGSGSVVREEQQLQPFVKQGLGLAALALLFGAITALASGVEKSN
jgi:hypothetical protein